MISLTENDWKFLTYGLMLSGAIMALSGSLSTGGISMFSFGIGGLVAEKLIGTKIGEASK